jgi:hypothetical protein
MIEFHISRSARDRYQVEDALFGARGNVIFTNFSAARRLAQALNEPKDLVQHPERSIRAGDLNAMGLLDEILHLVIEQYRQQINPSVLQQALEWLASDIGLEDLDSTLHQFIEEFPTSDLYRGKTDVEAYRTGQTEGIPNRQVALEELLMLWLDNENPAFTPCLELFDHTSLVRKTAYNRLLGSLYDFFETQPVFGPDQENLIDMLRRPALESPDSLAGQLQFIRQRWGNLVGPLIFQLLSSLDFIQEEQRPIFLQARGRREYLNSAGCSLNPKISALTWIGCLAWS